MVRTAHPRIKVCCIASEEEARLAVAHGADAVGFVSEMPSGPGVLAEEQIAEIAVTVPPPVATFLLTSLRDADAIEAQHRRCRTGVLQLVDRLPTGELRRLRKKLPGIRVVQVVHVVGPASVEEACSVAARVDALLLDSGDPDKAIKELGGTGRTHDWHLSRMIRGLVHTPVFLAGGLHADNVAAAIAAVRPFGLDLCSGVRSDGALDPAKLSRFTSAVAAASRPGR